MQQSSLLDSKAIDLEEVFLQNPKLFLLKKNSYGFKGVLYISERVTKLLSGPVFLSQAKYESIPWTVSIKVIETIPSILQQVYLFVPVIGWMSANQALQIVCSLIIQKQNKLPYGISLIPFELIERKLIYIEHTPQGYGVEIADSVDDIPKQRPFYGIVTM